MTVAERHAESHRRLFEAFGEIVTLRRMQADGAYTDVPGVWARISGMEAVPLAGGVDQLGRKALLLAEDVAAGMFPLPFKTGGADRIVLNDGRVLTIEEVDDRKRRLGGTLLAYELTVTG